MVRRWWHTPGSVRCQRHSLSKQRGHPLEGVPQCCSGARARWERRHRWYGGRRELPGACHAKASSPPSNVGPSVSIPPSIALPRRKAAVCGMPLEGVLECCSGARARGDGTTGKEGVGNSQERAMPQPHCRQATWAPQVSVAVVALSSRIAHVRIPSLNNSPLGTPTLHKII